MFFPLLFHRNNVNFRFSNGIPRCQKNFRIFSLGILGKYFAAVNHNENEKSLETLNCYLTFYTYEIILWLQKLYERMCNTGEDEYSHSLESLPTTVYWKIVKCIEIVRNVSY